MKFPKDIVFKSRKYLDWIKSRECLCRYHQGEPISVKFTSDLCFLNIIDPHHVTSRSRDDQTVPLCRWSHYLTKSVPPGEWMETMGFDQNILEETAILLREEYLKGGYDV